MEFDALSVFRMYDVNGDGYLRGDDLAAFADKLFHDLLPPGDTQRRQALQDAYRELWTQLSAVADVDRSGHIGEQEYLAAMGRGAGHGGDHFRKPQGRTTFSGRVRALICLATLANVAIACNKATADLIMSAPAVRAGLTGVDMQPAGCLL